MRPEELDNEYERLRKEFENKKDSILDPPGKKVNPEDFGNLWNQMLDETENVRDKMRQNRHEYDTITDIEWKDIPTHGDLMTMEEFKEACQLGFLIDYDGFGNYSTATKMASNKNISPSDLKKGTYLKDPIFTHVVWYNR